MTSNLSPVHAGQGEAEEGAEAGSETHGGHRLAQPWLVIEPGLSFQYGWLAVEIR